MKLGLFSMPCHPPHRTHAETFDEDLELLATEVMPQLAGLTGEPATAGAR
jgi:hypothetical protein